MNDEIDEKLVAAIHKVDHLRDDCTPERLDQLEKLLKDAREIVRQDRSNFDKLGEFYTKFGFPTAYDRAPQLIDLKTFRFRRNFFVEEALEFNDAYYDEDLVGVADAIGDILYIAYGAAHFFAIPIQEVFDAIHRANMKKEKKPTARSDQFDVVKPPGWVGPEAEIEQILKNAGKEP